MRPKRALDRKCEVCGAPYRHKHGGRNFGRYCSQRCAHEASITDHREHDRRDCIHYEECFDRAAFAPKCVRNVCAKGCVLFMRGEVRVHRANGSIQSSAWIWEES